MIWLLPAADSALRALSLTTLNQCHSPAGPQSRCQDLLVLLQRWGLGLRPPDRGILHQEALTGATSIPSPSGVWRGLRAAVSQVSQPLRGVRRTRLEVCAELCCNEARKVQTLLAPSVQCQEHVCFAAAPLLTAKLYWSQRWLLRGQSEPL